MRAENFWLFAVNVWLAAIWVSTSAPIWIAAVAAGLCIGMSIKIRRDRSDYNGMTGRTRKVR
jgi:hypothetical protein